MDNDLVKRVIELLNCGNCRYPYFLPNDREEIERCRISGKYHEFPVNQIAKNFIKRYNLKEVCEYFDPKIKF